MQAIRQFFEVYVTDGGIGAVIDGREFSGLADTPKVSLTDLSALDQWRDVSRKQVKN